MGADAAAETSDRVPERDEIYLDSKELNWELLREPDGLWLAIIGYRFDVQRFDRESLPETAAERGAETPPDHEQRPMDRWESSLGDDEVVLLIKIPPQYPQAKLDMFWLWPHLRLKGSQSYPDRATHFEQHLDRRVQRFSRHLQQWRPNVDGLAGYLSLIHGILNPR